MSNLTTVDFHGDKLQAIEVDGKLQVAIRPMCDALGVDASSQIKKLKSKAWACMVIITTQDSSGRSQEMACLDLDSVPMWLAGIEASKVAERVRPKLLVFQLEAARALRDHFFPKLSQVSDSPSPAGAIQARIGDDPRARAHLYGMFRAAAAASGRTVQSLHGEIRRPWGVSSVYRIALSSLEHTVARVEEILYSALKIKRLPAHERQLGLRFIEGGASESGGAK